MNNIIFIYYLTHLVEQTQNCMTKKSLKTISQVHHNDVRISKFIAPMNNQLQQLH